MRVTVTRGHLQIATLCLGALLVLFGVLKLVFKVNMGDFVEHNFGNGIMILAVGIFAWNRYLLAQEKKAREEEEAKLKPVEPAATNEVSTEIAPTKTEEPKA